MRLHVIASEATALTKAGVYPKNMHGESCDYYQD